MIRFGLSFAGLWAVVIGAALYYPASAGAIISGGIGASITLAVFVANRLQGRRQATLDLHKEYYSADFAALRELARQFMLRHAAIDWAATDPYEVGRDDEALRGYSAVVRFFHRFAVLYHHGELNRGLATRLLSREAGYWSALLFEPMAERRSMFTRESIAELCTLLAKGQGRVSFASGCADALRLVPRTPAKLQQSSEKTATPALTVPDTQRD